MMDGVVRPPSAFSITRGLSPSMTATQELVVPRSMPMILPMVCLSVLKLDSFAATASCQSILARWRAIQGSGRIFTLRHHHHRSADHAAIEAVAFLHHLN